MFWYSAIRSEDFLSRRFISCGLLSWHTVQVRLADRLLRNGLAAMAAVAVYERSPLKPHTAQVLHTEAVYLTLLQLERYGEIVIGLSLIHI